MSILVSGDQAAGAFAAAIGDARVVDRLAALGRYLDEAPDDLVVLGPDVDLGEALDFAAAQRVARPELGVLVVRSRVDAAVLAAAMRAGVREVVAGHDLQRLRMACTASLDLSAQVRQSTGLATGTAHGGKGRVVTVFGAKGGSGTTTVAVNLGVALTARGGRICVLDLDLAFGDVAMALRMLPERTLGDAVGMGETLDAAGAAALATPHSTGLHALLAPTAPSAAERITPDLVERLLDALRELYDTVVVDTPSAFTDAVLAALDVTDALLLVTTPDVAAIKNHKLTEQTLDQLALPAERRSVVLNKADASGGLGASEVRRMLGAPPVATLPLDGAVAVAANRGSPVVHHQARNPVVRALDVLANQVGGPVPTPLGAPAPARPAAGTGLRSVLRRRPVTR